MRRSYVGILWLICLALYLTISCSDSASPPPANTGPKPVVHELLATSAAGITVSVAANQTIEISTTDSVCTNPARPILFPDCDIWTDADGLPDCHYVTTYQECRGLPFMALIGSVEADEYFVVGTDFDSTFAGDVQLKLIINDWVYDDNAGKFTISVLKK